jgi:hypothetical protein
VASDPAKLKNRLSLNDLPSQFLTLRRQSDTIKLKAGIVEMVELE